MGSHKPIRDISEDSVLRTPLQIGPWRLAHRIVEAPGARRWVDGESGSPTLHMVKYYSDRTSPGGLIIAESAAVSASGLAQLGAAAIFSAEHANSWRALVDQVHGRGGVILAQLWHAGRLARAIAIGQQPMSASAIAARPPTYAPEEDRSPTDVPQAMIEDGIESVIDCYRQAAEHAADAGFDGVELHAADGCLVDQYLHDNSNHRSDTYGGRIEFRSRFLIDAVEALTSVWGPERVGVRVSPLGLLNDVTDSDPRSLYSHVAQRLGEEGIAYLHVTNSTPPTKNLRHMTSALEVMPICRREFSQVLIASGCQDVSGAEAMIRAGLADAVVLE